VLWGIIAFALLGNGSRAGELFSVVNPINHARSRTAALRYRVEPYVACGDVYSMPPNVGRGGWTWYSGSAAWMYRIAVETILGLRRQGEFLTIDPRIPANWPKFEATIRHFGSTYQILVENPDRRCQGIAQIAVDGVAGNSLRGVLLARDGKEHRVHVIMGAPAAADKS
jgi:cyclic beta-1,2-glucan synthetase